MKERQYLRKDLVQNNKVKQLPLITLLTMKPPQLMNKNIKQLVKNKILLVFKKKSLEVNLKLNLLLNHKILEIAMFLFSLINKNRRTLSNL